MNFWNASWDILRPFPMRSRLLSVANRVLLDLGPDYSPAIFANAITNPYFFLPCCNSHSRVSSQLEWRSDRCDGIEWFWMPRLLDVRRGGSRLNGSSGLSESRCWIGRRPTDPRRARGGRGGVESAVGAGRPSGEVGRASTESDPGVAGPMRSVGLEG